MAQKTSQTMKPQTAAKKLGIHLPAAPAEFREAEAVTRSELARLMTSPPAWLETLRRDGPHPREVVAARLAVSIAGLARGGVTEPLTTAQIEELREEDPPWLARERASLAAVRADEEVRQAQAAKEARRAASGAAGAPGPAGGSAW